MNILWHSFVLATTMYSKIPIPMPLDQWDDRFMTYVFCFFPWIGLVIGALELGWFWLVDALGLGSLLYAAVAVLIPIAVSGGIHIDGFCDTCDALASHQSRERMLEILKDSNTGAFALLGLCCYLLLFTAVWTETVPCLALILIPVLSRTLSGLCAMTMKNARGSGLLASFSNASDLRTNRIVLGIWLLAVVIALILTGGWPALVGAALTLAYYVYKSNKVFGGITGDLEGWFVTVCELVCVLSMMLAQKGGLL